MCAPGGKTVGIPHRQVRYASQWEKWLVLTERVGIGNHVVGPDENSRETTKTTQFTEDHLWLVGHSDVADPDGKCRDPHREQNTRIAVPCFTHDTPSSALLCRGWRLKHRDKDIRFMVNPYLNGPIVQHPDGKCRDYRCRDHQNRETNVSQTFRVGSPTMACSRTNTTRSA